MTIGQVIDLMRGVLDDDATTKYWPDSDLVQNIGAAQAMFMAVGPEDALTEVEGTAIVTAQGVATGETFSVTPLPTTFSRFRAARVRNLTTTTFYTAKKIEIEEFMAQERLSTDSPERATEQSPVCAIWGRNLYVAPLPVVTTNALQLFYMGLPTAITASTATSTALSINEVHQYALADYALYLAFNKMDPNRAALHLNTFAAYVQGIGGRWPGYHLADPEPRRIAARLIQ